MIKNINDIQADNLYKPSEIALFLDVHESTVTRKCQNWTIIAKNVGTEKRSTWRIIWKDLLNYLTNEVIDLKELKFGDKVVYDWAGRKEYILIEEIKDFETEAVGTDEKSKVTLINGKYCISWPLRKPTPLELEVANFI